MNAVSATNFDAGGLIAINRAMGTSSGKVVLGVRGVGLSGLSLQHVQAVYSKKGISLDRLFAINAFIAAYSKEEGTKIKSQFLEIQKNAKNQTEASMEMVKVLKTLKYSPYSAVQETVKGMAVSLFA